MQSVCGSYRQKLKGRRDAVLYVPWHVYMNELTSEFWEECRRRNIKVYPAEVYNKRSGTIVQL